MDAIAALRKEYEPRLALGAVSDFSRALLGAAFDNLQNEGPLRFNNFSYALREFVRHMLKDAAPSDEVKACIWFKPDKNSKTGITRKHRAKYAIQGGLSDKFVEKKLGVDSGKTLKDLVAAHDTLSRYTHIEPGTFNVPLADTEKLAEECLQSAAAYVELILECRRSVRDAVADHVDQHLIDEVVANGIDELYEIATHGWVDGHWINDVSVDDISSDSVSLTVEGSMDFGLQYGSDGDVKRDIGFVTSASFPFDAKILVEMKAPLGKHASVERLKVDTDSFYQ
ncbi:hypothetical protein Flexsi_0422 [Flexistipes sinusarabici DSM 4947]|uniref:Uncharacterized protein n=1 Tax=Flexistipes sinusarabici (strain ATCC 49648 / DSM 4947 / MAS 10) TaxID=717231 RepID=F8E8Y6_FLESM|nr:hypothetical protein [Flexistipes sinusarabici]AEI14110.1 hypothetical protein Flexsi_0422 [Flexistipes sinusarabici DSM 4947]